MSDDWDEEDWDDQEDWEDDSTPAGGFVRPGSRRWQRGLALGVLASAPLAVLYEWSLWSSDGAVRNTAERLVTLPVSWADAWADPIRQLALLAALLAALFVARNAALDDAVALAPRTLRVPLDGLVAALLLGPALVFGQQLLGAEPVPLGYGDASVPRPSPTLRSGAAAAGGAFYEELVFRVGMLSLFHVGWRVLGEFLGAPRRLARLFAELGGIATSAAVFAAFHLDAISAFVGITGEVFDGPTFTWRFVGGCLLGVLYRWRGFGAAVWCHGLFNLALLLGAGPDVLS